MTAIAQQLEEELAKLDPQAAEQLTQAIREMLMAAKKAAPKATEQAEEAWRSILSRKHSFGIKPGIDPNKLGQLPDAF